MPEIKLEKLQDFDREQFIIDNQEAFNYGALEEFGKRDDHFEEDGQIISRELWNSITATTQTRMIRNCRSILTSSSQRVCSGLRRGWINDNVDSFEKAT